MNQRWSQRHNLRDQNQGRKKIRGQDQGPTFRGQTLSRPRAGMIEAKAKIRGRNFSELLSANFPSFLKRKSL